MALTDREILALKPRDRKYKVFDGDGLFIVVHPKGGKYWYMKYHIAARPQPQSRLEKKAARQAQTVVFAGVADEWLRMMSTSSAPSENDSDRARAPLDPATVRKHRWLLGTYLIPALGNWPMGQITAQQLLPVLKQIEAAGKSETAHRARSIAGRIFCYAHATGRALQGDITLSPCGMHSRLLSQPITRRSPIRRKSASSCSPLMAIRGSSRPAAH